MTDFFKPESLLIDIPANGMGFTQAMIATTPLFADLAERQTKTLESMNELHAEYLEKVRALAVIEPAKLKAKAAELRAQAQAARQAVASADVVFSDELEALRATSKAQTMVFGKGLDHDEAITEADGDLKLVKALESLYQELGNTRAAQACRTAIVDAIAPGAADEAVRLDAAAGEIDRHLAANAERWDRAVGKLDPDWREPGFDYAR